MLGLLPLSGRVSSCPAVHPDCVVAVFLNFSSIRALLKCLLFAHKLVKLVGTSDVQVIFLPRPHREANFYMQMCGCDRMVSTDAVPSGALWMARCQCLHWPLKRCGFSDSLLRLNRICIGCQRTQHLHYWLFSVLMSSLACLVLLGEKPSLTCGIC